MKKLIIILILILFYITGCKERNNIIVFNDEPFSKDNFYQVKSNFRAGTRVYYLVATSKKLKPPYIRVQVSNVTDKVHTLFYKPIWASDYKLMKDEVYYYTNYFVMQGKGKYLIQIFRLDDLHHPLSFAFFTVD